MFKKPDFLKAPLERFREQIENQMGGKAQVFREKSARKKMPFVYTLAFPDAQTQELSAFSYGVSHASHPEQLHQVELCLQVQSADMAWAHIVGYLANQLRGDCPFRKGEIIKIGQAIASDSTMDAFVVAEPDIFLENTPIKDHKKSKGIHLVQLIPIYQEEILKINKIGLEAFLSQLSAHKKQVNRKPL